MRSRRSYGAPVAAMGLDADALLWRDAVVTNGGSVSAARLAVVSAFIIAEKTAGIWALTDDYWVFWAENAIQALTSLKQRRLATAVNSPVFTTNRGYAFDGTTNYINTGFIPSTHAVAMTGTDLRLATYERTNNGATTCSMGSYTAGTNTVRVYPRTTGNRAGAYLNNTTFLQTVGTVVDSRGLVAVSLDGGSHSISKNGVALSLDSSPTSPGTSLSSAPLGIAAYISTVPAASGFRVMEAGFACVGASLSPAQELAQYNATQAFATAVGAQV